MHDKIQFLFEWLCYVVDVAPPDKYKRGSFPKFDKQYRIKWNTEDDNPEDHSKFVGMKLKNMFAAHNAQIKEEQNGRSTRRVRR